MPPAPIRILHLSDFHFSEKKAWDADPVMQQLATAIGQDVAEGLTPDLVAITGDLAFSGRKKEYDSAREWLEQRLWPQLAGLDRDRLLLVPGNHDVDREAIKRSAKALRIALLHHPWPYLAEFDQNDARGLIHQHCDLVLRGHLHKAQSERILPPDLGRAYLELAAGCVYESSNYPNAYQWIELWPEGQNGEHAAGRVHFRTWRDQEWMPDRNPKSRKYYEAGMRPPPCCWNAWAGSPCTCPAPPAPASPPSAAGRCCRPVPSAAMPTRSRPPRTTGRHPPRRCASICRCWSHCVNSGARWTAATGARTGAIAAPGRASDPCNH